MMDDWDVKTRNMDNVLAWKFTSVGELISHFYIYNFNGLKTSMGERRTCGALLRAWR
jgi:hypothetical protein